MTAVVVLGLYAVVMLMAAPQLLARARWTLRAPMAGVLAWQAATWSALLAAALGGVLLAYPLLPLGAPADAVLLACLEAVHLPSGAHPAEPVSAAVRLLAATATVLVAGRVVLELVRLRRGVDGTRAAVRALLAPVARRHEEYGVLVLPDPRPMAYCLPGRSREVVVTTGALEALPRDQLAAVVAHERAHLRGRHDLVLLVADAARTSFRWVGALATASAAQAQLLEMVADDAAARVVGRRSVAMAILALASPSAPAPAALATVSSTASRLTRLLEERQGSTWQQPAWELPTRRLSTAASGLAACVAVAGLLVCGDAGSALMA